MAVPVNPDLDDKQDPSPDDSETRAVIERVDDLLRDLANERLGEDPISESRQQAAQDRQGEARLFTLPGLQEELRRIITDRSNRVDARLRAISDLARISGLEVFRDDSNIQRLSNEELQNAWEQVLVAMSPFEVVSSDEEQVFFMALRGLGPAAELWRKIKSEDRLKIKKRGPKKKVAEPSQIRTASVPQVRPEVSDAGSDSAGDSAPDS